MSWEAEYSVVSCREPSLSRLLMCACTAWDITEILSYILTHAKKKPSYQLMTSNSQSAPAAGCKVCWAVQGITVQLKSGLCKHADGCQFRKMRRDKLWPQMIRPGQTSTISRKEISIPSPWETQFAFPPWILEGDLWCELTEPSCRVEQWDKCLLIWFYNRFTLTNKTNKSAPGSLTHLLYYLPC